MNTEPVDKVEPLHAGSLAPLEKTRGFGMTPLKREEIPYGFVILSGLTH
jgi:hypothetical protein